MIFSSREFLGLSIVLKVGLVILFILSAIINASYIMERRETIKRYEIEKRYNLAQYLYILASLLLSIYAFFRVWVVDEFYQVVISLLVGVVFLLLTVLLLWGLKYSNNGRR